MALFHTIRSLTSKTQKTLFSDVIFYFTSHLLSAFVKGERHGNRALRGVGNTVLDETLFIGFEVKESFIFLGLSGIVKEFFLVLVHVRGIPEKFFTDRFNFFIISNLKVVLDELILFVIVLYNVNVFVWNFILHFTFYLISK